MKEIVRPREVNLSDAAIVILWDDGHRSIHPHRFLRLRCQCAQCVDEMSGRPRLDPARVPQDVQAVDYMPVGNYALQFLWSDAHYTGIYTFRFLRAVCTCLACNAARGKTDAPEKS
jgi:ATP-binding protein involved in chromosome partitioning